MARFGFHLFVFLGLCVGSWLHAQLLVRPVYVQVATPTSVILRWRTAVPTTSEVKFGTSQSDLNRTVALEELTREHRVLITGLEPNTRYYYTYGSVGVPQNTPSQHVYFKTQPVKGSTTPLRFWACGDVGSYNSNQYNVRNSFLQFNGDTHVDGWLLLGDIIYKKGDFDDGSDTLYTTDFFGTYRDVLRKFIVWPAPGNHDYESVNMFQSTGPYFDSYDMPTAGEAGGVPSNTKAYYSFDYGNAHLISLNSENWQWATSSSSPQAKWLREDLAATNQTWKIAYWHAPPYTKGSHNSDDPFIVGMMAPMRQNYVPILEEYDVDLVLCGHSHNYERSKLINGHYGQSQSFNPGQNLIDGGSGSLSEGKPYVKQAEGGKGTVYVVSGCGGKLSTNDGTLNHPVMFMSQDTVAGSSVIDIHGDTLRHRFLTSKGQIIDDFTIIKQRKTSVLTIEQPEYTLRLVPNPVRSELILKSTLNRAQKASVRLVSLAGSVLHDWQILDLPAGDSNHDLSHLIQSLGTGVYFVEVNLAGRNWTQRFIKVD